MIQKMIMNCEKVRILKDAVVAYFVTLLTISRGI
jgi:hypothetical protein